jgi:hypothetical protein
MLPATKPTPQQTAVQEEYRRWHEARWASFQQRPVYRTTCSLCGDPSDQQVCAGCAVYMGEHGL